MVGAQMARTRVGVNVSTGHCCQGQGSGAELAVGLGFAFTMRRSRLRAVMQQLSASRRHFLVITFVQETVYHVWSVLLGLKTCI